MPPTGSFSVSFCNMCICVHDKQRFLMVQRQHCQGASAGGSIPRGAASSATTTHNTEGILKNLKTLPTISAYSFLSVLRFPFVICAVVAGGCRGSMMKGQHGPGAAWGSMVRGQHALGAAASSRGSMVQSGQPGLVAFLAFEAFEGT